MGLVLKTQLGFANWCSLGVALRRWGEEAVVAVEAAGGANWCLRLLTSACVEWQHTGAALLELYAAQPRGQRRLALRTEELANVLEVLMSVP